MYFNIKSVVLNYCNSNLHRRKTKYFLAKTSFPISLFHCRVPLDPCLAFVPVTMDQLSTGLGREIGCTTCETQDGHRCNACCGWGAWCCLLKTEHSWQSGPACLSYHNVYCIFPTPPWPNWKRRTRQARIRKTAIWKKKVVWIQFSKIPEWYFKIWCHDYTYMGGGQDSWLQLLVSPLGFILDLLQKVLWTILLSSFLLQPYRRYCFPTKEGNGKRPEHKDTTTGKKNADTWPHKQFFLALLYLHRKAWSKWTIFLAPTHINCPLPACCFEWQSHSPYSRCTCRTYSHPHLHLVSPATRHHHHW